MTDHDAIAAKVRQDRETGTPGPWKIGKNNPARVSREGRYIANFDPLHSNDPKCEDDARRAARLPDLEAAYLDLYDEVQRLRAERLYIVGWNAGWDEAQYQATHGHPSDGDITPKYEFTASEMAAVVAERDALRDALANIAVMGFDNDPAVSNAIAKSAVNQARAALKGDTK